jgi:hypothetical protein
MANTVIEAFNKFMADIVNLDPDDTKQARTSRDWLVDQILLFPTTHDDFPDIYIEKNIFYGSFERRTKKRPIDDIDFMICLKAMGCTYIEYTDRIEITVPDTASRFKKLCFDDSELLNSRKVINIFIDKLSDIQQYKNSEIHRNSEAATLELSSYDWNFDIVPCFFTTEDSLGRTYYVMPDGNGNWKKTDPRLDRQRVSTINSNHDGNVLNIIRAVKYWNTRPTMPSMGSYFLENMILDYFNSKTSKASSYVDIELVSVFYDLSTRVYSSVNDPKNIQGNLNDLTWDEREKISKRAQLDYQRASEARQLEKDKKIKESINKWREIFGDDFPEYSE